MLAWLLSIQLAAAPGQSACQAALQAMRDAQVLLSRGDEGNAQARLALSADAAACLPVQLAIRALRGWHQARALAPLGGAAEHLPPVRLTLDELQAIRAAGEWALETEYADTCIRAAIAAAQDERPEMELLLTHARDLAERLQLRDRRATWPLTFNLVAGELWFEVDRYEDARAAYERAARAEPSAVALVGLARALARLGRVEEACETFARVTDAASGLRAEAAKDLSRCR